MREFQRGAMRLHILYHAAEEGVHGAWLAEELARHGYRISPGTLYPTLHRLEAAGLLVSEQQVVDGRARRMYRATEAGRLALAEDRRALAELAREVLGERGFGVLWLQNVSGGPLVVERPAPDTETVTIGSMGIVQVVGAVAEALRDDYRIEYHEGSRSWSTSQWKLVHVERPQMAQTSTADVAAAGDVAKVSNLGVEGRLGGDQLGEALGRGAGGGVAVTRISVELLGQLVSQPRHTPAEERLIHSLLTVIAERTGATVAYTPGTANITMTTIDSDTSAPVTKTLRTGEDVQAR